MQKIVIVGAGIAGVSAAAELVRRAPDLDITLVGAEPDLPYDRPSLSKQFMTGDMDDPPPLPALPPTVATRFGRRALHLDAGRRIVTLDDGSALHFDQLLLAQGSACRPLTCPGGALLPSLRHVADARILRAQLLPGQRVIMIGGGFIGLELAVAARALGCKVRIHEAAPELLMRCGLPELGAWAHAAMVSQGIEVVLGSAATAVEQLDEGGVSVTFSDGQHHSADLAVVGIGVAPDVALAREAGITVDNGIVVDCFGRTNLEGIFAAGEVTSYPYGGDETLRMRSECWSAAQAQAVAVAATMAGMPTAYAELPWLWSDLGDHNIQILGQPGRAATLVNGPGMDEAHWIRYGFDREGAFVGAIAVNAPQAMSQLRRKLRRGERVAPQDGAVVLHSA